MNIDAYEHRENIYWPMLSVSPNFSVIYWKPEKPYNRALTEQDKLNMKFNSCFGMLSQKAKSKIRKAVNYLIYISNYQDVCLVAEKKQIKFKINFITLTLPSKQKHDDKIIRKDCLHHFITELQQKYKLKHYLWKAEKQDNGNIHFHFTSNVFIHWRELRTIWNRILEKLGYVSEYRKNMLNHHKNGFTPFEHLLVTWPIESQKKAYERGITNNWTDPNSTDVHSVKNVRDLSAYISEYFTKSPLPEAEMELYKESVQLSKKLQYLIQKANSELSSTNNNDIASINYLNNEIATHTQNLSNKLKIIEKYSKYFVTCDIWNLSRSISNIKISIDLTDEHFNSEINNFTNTNQNLIDCIDNFSIIKCHIKQLATLGCIEIKKKFDDELNAHLLKYV